MPDASALEDAKPEPLSSCPRCGSTSFEEGRALGLSKELYCCECNAGYRVNVLHDGLFVVERIRPRPRRSLVSPPGHRRRRTDT